MKANRLSDVVYTDKNLPAKKMKNYFMYVGKNIAASIVQESKNCLSLVKGRGRIPSFILMLMLRKFKILIGLSKIEIWYVIIYGTIIICSWLELEMKVLINQINNF